MERTLEELARRVGGTVFGDGAVLIRGVCGLEDAGPDDITFLANPRYASKLAQTRAGAVVLSEQAPKPAIPAIVVKDPNFAFIAIAKEFAPAAPAAPASPGVHPSAVVAATARLGPGVSVGPNAVIEEEASIGEGTRVHALTYIGPHVKMGRECVIYPHVSIRERCVVGDRVIIHCGTAIGSDGFGYATLGDVHHKIPQNGIVEIEDDVEIGANCTLDRARLGRTLVKRGAKLDNMVHLAHNVVVGARALLAAQVGIAGSSKVGDGAMLGGQAGVGGHLDIGPGGMLTAQSGLGKDLPPGEMFAGSPAQPFMKTRRAEAALSRVPEMLNEIRSLRKKVEALEQRPTP